MDTPSNVQQEKILHPVVASDVTECDRIYGSWDISYSDHVIHIDDPRTFLFQGIKQDRYDIVLQAVAAGANPNSVYMPICDDIQLLDFDKLFGPDNANEWVKKNGMTAIALCITCGRPKALRALIESGAVIENAYLICMQGTATENGVSLKPALDDAVFAELFKVKQGWEFFGGADGVLYTGELRGEVIEKSWKPMFSGSVTKTRPAGTSGCFIATACYGDANAPSVLVLREYRDSKLLMHPLGRLFVRLYYTFAPPFSRFLSRHKRIATCITNVILNPIVALIRSKEGRLGGGQHSIQ